MKHIKLLLIEDNPILREGLTAMLAEARDFKITAAAVRGQDGLSRIRKLKPDVILLDLGLRSLNSLRVVEIVSKEFPHAKVIVMDLAPVHGDIIQFVKAGASGFILKDATQEEFLTTIRAVAGGAKVLPSLLAESLFTEIVRHAVTGGPARVKEALRMTRREREVVALIGEGMTNIEIGRKLRISSHTVKSHVHNIMEKLVLHTRLEIANFVFTDRAARSSHSAE